jgi:hypothetical protein
MFNDVEKGHGTYFEQILLTDSLSSTAFFKNAVSSLPLICESWIAFLEATFLI